MKTLVFVLASLLGGYTIGAIAMPMRAPASCIDALNRADRLMDDMASFGKSSVAGLGAILVGGSYSPSGDSAYLRMMAGAAPYREAAMRCRN